MATIKLSLKKQENKITLNKLDVKLSGGVEATGTYEIDANGVYNVKYFEFASVNVPIPEGYLKPEGTLEINNNGEHEVTNYEKVNVNVELDTSVEDGLLKGTLTSLYNDRVTSIRAYCFRGYQTLTSIELPNVTSVSQESFATTRCKKPIMPKLETIGVKAFDYSSLEELEAPLKTISAHAFIGTPIKKLVITQDEKVCSLVNANAFAGSAIASGTGYIYVPDSRLEEYKVYTNWSTYASQIKPLSELPTEE